jgi:cytochrome c oxidase subunit 2
VLHSYWVPKLGGKQDVIPGRMVTLNIQADEPGRYLGQCAEYCGLSHANMRNRAVALDMADFEAWVAAQQQPAAEPSDELAVQGQELFTANCAACHTINTSAVSSAEDFSNAIAPNLTHLMSRKEFAGAIFDLYQRDADGNFTDEPNVDLLKEWLRDPPAMKAMRPADGIGMPNLNLSEDQIDALVAYLTTLR